MDLAPLGRVVLILFQNSSAAPSEVNDPSVYRGWVLVPDGKPLSYGIHVLPSLKDGFGTLDYDIKSVFAADADGDGTAELCILSAVNQLGSGDAGRPYYDTDLFKWTGGTFTLVDQGDKRPLYGLRNAKAVRDRLKQRLAPKGPGQ